MDVLPFDVPVSSTPDFLSEYRFFQVDLNPNDNITVVNSKLHIYSTQTSTLILPDLRFGAAREITISFYFTIDDFGTEDGIPKEFGFLFGSYKIFFIPEMDAAGIDQFRYVHLQKGEKEAEQHRITTFSFLEGERVRCNINVSQDGISYIQLSKMGSHLDDVFMLPLTFTLAGYSHPMRNATANFSVYISAATARSHSHWRVCHCCKRLHQLWIPR